MIAGEYQAEAENHEIDPEQQSNLSNSPTSLPSPRNSNFGKKMSSRKTDDPIQNLE